jgi:hypothetical protein
MHPEIYNLRVVMGRGRIKALIKKYPNGFNKLHNKIFKFEQQNFMRVEIFTGINIKSRVPCDVTLYSLVDT